jgi:hypothetical protein
MPPWGGQLHRAGGRLAAGPRLLDSVRALRVSCRRCPMRSLSGEGHALPASPGRRDRSLGWRSGPLGAWNPKTRQCSRCLLTPPPPPRPYHARPDSAFKKPSCVPFIFCACSMPRFDHRRGGSGASRDLRRQRRLSEHRLAERARRKWLDLPAFLCSRFSCLHRRS